MTDFSEALKILAFDVVGLSNPDDVDGDEMLYWRDIRRALEAAEPKPFQRKCWQAGVVSGHLCGPHCANEATQQDIDAFVDKYHKEKQEERRAFEEHFRKIMGND